jgi:quinol monooxygenase YgiN
MRINKVTVLALVKAKKGLEEALRKECLSLVTPTRSEPGCIDYDLHQATDDKSVFMFYENWQSMEDLEKHRETPHLKAFREKAGTLLETPIEVTLFHMIDQS